MHKLSPHFKRAEFSCQGASCCWHSSPVNERLIKALEGLRILLQAPITITSGFRCNRHNTNIGGAADSYHTLGMAADIKVQGYSPAGIAALAEDIPDFRAGGIGIYSGWVHLDVRTSGAARWDKRTAK